MPIWGTDQIAVKIPHKNRLLTDPGAIEDVLAVENDVAPFDRADVLEQGRVDAFLCDSIVKLSGILGFWRRKRSAVECRINNLGSGRGAD